MSGPAVLAVDLGTSVVKAGVVGDGGRLLALAERDIELLHGAHPGWLEQDAAAWWTQARGAIRDAVSRAAGARIVAACVGGQGPSIVAVDEHGEPVANALIWMDARAEAERGALSERLGAEVSPYSSVPRAMWLARSAPGVPGRARWFLQAWDYLAFRLTGIAVASSFEGDDVFPGAHVAAAGLDAARFPPALRMGTPIGPVRPEVARELGLPAGVVVAGGVNDFTAAVLGAGLDRRGLALDLGGTSGGLALAWDEPLDRHGLTAWPAPTAGLYICGGPLAAGGRSVTWFAQAAGYGAGGLAALEQDASSVGPGADGVVFLPYLSGERTPLWDEDARGVFFGLAERHTRAHLARAVLEGVAFALRHIADTLATDGARIAELRLGGGQARLALWARIKADVLAAPVVVPKVTEVSVLGEAMLAARAVPSARDAAGSRGAADAAARVEPTHTGDEAYARAYATYRELYPRLRDLMAAR